VLSRRPFRAIGSVRRRVFRVSTRRALWKSVRRLISDPDASGTEDFRLRLDRAIGANGAATITNTGSGGLNVVPGSGGFKVNGVELVGRSVGEVIEWLGSTLPAKCVWANGQNLDRTTHSALFAVTGTTYGAGNGSTTFGVIDKRGRVSAGKDDMGGSAASRLTGLSGGVNGAVLGAAGGSQSHVLTLAELAAHFHTTTLSAYYGMNDSSSRKGWSSGDSTSGSGRANDSDSKGGDAPHNNVQPTIIVNYIVYTGV